MTLTKKMLVLSSFIFFNLLLHINPSHAIELRTLTYNTWALSFPFQPFSKASAFEIPVAPDSEIRILTLCKLLKNQDPEKKFDLILLQELWNKRDRQVMKDCGYPYQVDLDDLSFMQRLDSGLMILSRYPIGETKRLTFNSNGSWKHPFDGEWFARKSGIMAKITHPEKGDFWVANAHLVARYPHESYAEQRAEQFFDFYIWAKTKAHEAPLIFGGDLNVDYLSKHRDTNYEELVSFLKIMPGLLRWGMDDQTTSSSDNPWTNGQGSGLIDFLFASNDYFLATSGGLALNEEFYINAYQEKRCLSDHYGWKTNFEWLNSYAASELELPEARN